MSYYLNIWNFNLIYEILLIKLLDVSNTWLVEGIPTFNYWLKKKNTKRKGIRQLNLIANRSKHFCR